MSIVKTLIEQSWKVDTSLIYHGSAMGWVQNGSPELDTISKYPVILAVCISLTTVMVGIVFTRLVFRYRTRQLAADDYVMAVAMVFSVVYSSLCIAQSRYGLGLPLKMRPKADLDIYTKINFAGRPFYQIGIAGFKAALCLSYLRLLSGTSKQLYKIVIWGVGAVSTLGHIAGALVLLFFCTPMQRSWDPTVHGHCLPPGPSFLVLALFTIACDVVIILLPIPLLLNLKIKPAQKAGIVCLFLLGLFTTICSILRCVQINQISHGDGDSTMLVLWGTIEFNVGNIVTSLPFLAPLLRSFVRDFQSSYGVYKTPKKSSYALRSLSRDHQRSCEKSETTTRTVIERRRAGSEESILHSEGLGQHHGQGISMTVEYNVTYNAR